MSDSQEIFWTAGFLNERFPAPVSPLGWSVIGTLFEQYALREPLRYMGYPEADKIPATRLFNGHPYSNVLIFQIIYNPFPDALLPADAVRYFPGGDMSWRTRAPYPRSILNPRFLLALIFHVARDPINVSPFNYWQWQRLARRFDERVAPLHARLDRAATNAEILAVVRDTNRLHVELLKIHRWSLTYADIFYKLLARLAAEDAQALISQVPNLTQVVNRELRALAQLAAELSVPLDSVEQMRAALQDPRRREFAEALEKFLREHGHRSFTLDLARPTFRDDPSQFLPLLSQADAPSAFVPAWQTTRAQVRRRLPRSQRIFFDVVLAFARRYAQLRENQRYYWQKSLAVSRRAYLLLAARENFGDAPQDIFYATAEEIEGFVSAQSHRPALRAQIQLRRKQYQTFQREYLESPSRAYPSFLRGDIPLDLDRLPQDGIWQGRGVSPGQASGAVRIILDARDLGQVAPGEILVAPSTDPGWTPVFGRVAGLVLERGGVLAHGAIVAREYHLPAVAGIPNITRELSDGDWVQVDGTRGVIRKIKKIGSSSPAA